MLQQHATKHNKMKYIIAVIVTLFLAVFVAAQGRLARVMKRNDAKPCRCPMNYHPVCTDAGKIYSNACLAKCVGVTDAASGKCAQFQFGL
jgi:hypothetical protein